jgi:hypothetical protein
MNNSLLAEIDITFLSVFICGQARGVLFWLWTGGVTVQGTEWLSELHGSTNGLRGIKNTFAPNKSDRSCSKISGLLCCFNLYHCN